MSNLNRDQLRVVVCFAGIFGLFVQLIAQSFFGAEVGAGLTGTFGTLATLPVVDSAVERYSSKRGPTDPPDPPPPVEEESTTDRITRRSDEQQRERSGMDLLVAGA